MRRDEAPSSLRSFASPRPIVLRAFLRLPLASAAKVLQSAYKRELT
jgi:hypothetical protein